MSAAARPERDRRAAGQRRLRVGEALRHAVAEVLLRGELRDPALRGRSVTVSEVRVSVDLRAATVFVCPLGGGGDEASVIEGLQRAAPHLGARVAASLRLRNMPRLRFVSDPAFDRAARVASLIAADPPPQEG